MANDLLPQLISKNQEDINALIDLSSELAKKILNGIIKHYESLPRTEPIRSPIPPPTPFSPSPPLTTRPPKRKRIPHSRQSSPPIDESRINPLPETIPGDTIQHSRVVDIRHRLIREALKPHPQGLYPRDIEDHLKHRNFPADDPYYRKKINHHTRFEECVDSDLRQMKDQGFAEKTPTGHWKWIGQ